MINWLGLLLLILVVVIAWRMWNASYSGGFVMGGAKKAKAEDKSETSEDESSDSKHEMVAYKEFQSYTITEDGHFVRASFNDHGGKKSILVLYNNGSRDGSGKLSQGEVQIAFKIEDGAIDKDNVKLQNVEKLDKRGREVITKALMSLKSRFDAATTKGIKSTLDWIEM